MPELPSGTRLHFPPFHLREDVDLLYRGDEVIPLEPQAVRVLRYLVENHERVVPTRELHDAVWPDLSTSDSVLKKAVYQARKALRTATDEERIRTFHSRGYQFTGEVRAGTGDAASPAEKVQADVETPPDPARPDYDQLVGRDSELGALRHELAAACEGKGRPVLLTGMAGIGKTQLAHRFLRQARQTGAVCLEARFFDYPTSTLAPFETFTDLLRKALHLTSRDPETLRAAVRERLGVTLPSELAAGAADGEALRPSEGEIFRAVVPIADCFVTLSREAPLVLVLDDLQWADAASLEVIGYLMRTAQEERLMIVGLVRSGEPESDSSIQRWLEKQARYRTSTTIALGPLDEPALRDCLLRVFGGDATAPEIPPNDFAQIASTSGGSPYFFTEMLRVLTAGGSIQWSDGPPARWEWKGSEEMRLPESLVMAARDRIGRLSPEVLSLIEEASVIGDEFRLITLATMSGRDPDEVERLCAEAVSCGVLLPQRSATADRRFIHAILWRVVYDSLPHHHRRTLHERAASAIKRVYAEQIGRVAGVIASHYERAGRMKDTCAWSIQAARVAATRWEWSEVVTHLERARSVVASDDRPIDVQQQLVLDIGLGEAYLSLGRLKEAERLLAGAALLAGERNRESELAAALLGLGQTRIGLSDYREALAATEKSHALYRTMGSAGGVQRSLVQTGTIQVAMGRYDAAGPVIESVLASADDDSEAAALARGTLGWARAVQGRWEEAVPLLRRAIRDADRLGDARRRAVLLRRLHWVELSRGELEAAVALAVQAREASRGVGDVAADAKCSMAIGQARIAQGLWEEGIRFLQATIDSLGTIGDRHCEAEALWLLGQARMETGENEEARRCLDRALEMIREIGDRDDEFRILTDLAACMRIEDDLEGALEASREAERIAAELGNENGIASARLRRAKIALSSGDAESAAAMAGTAAETLERNRSGESWRAWWILGEAHAELGGLEAGLDAMTRAVGKLDRIRGQVDIADRDRREAITGARRAEASGLAGLLRRMGRDAEAAAVARAWSLEPDETIPHPEFGRRAKRSSG